MTRRSILLFAPAILACGCRQPARSDWPHGRVRLVTPLAAGSTGDGVARTLAEGLAARWKTTVTVENVPGADGILAVQSFLDNTSQESLLLSFTGIVTANPILHKTLPYRADRDLAPISTVVGDVMALVASNPTPANSLAELVSIARAKPDKLTFSASAGTPELQFRALLRAAGVSMTFIPYRNPMAVVPDLIQGRVNVAVLPLTAVLGQVRESRMKVLSVLNDKRSPVLSGAPTIAEAGYPQLTFNGGLVLFGRAEMSPNIRERIAGEVRDFLLVPAVAERLSSAGYVPGGSTPEELSVRLVAMRQQLQAMAEGQTR